MSTMSTCSFCGRAHSEVEKLISGPTNITICERCVALAYEALCRGGVDMDKWRAYALEVEKDTQRAMANPRPVMNS
jgi:ATP-dependent protease Clp ATPase subunit